MREKMEEVKVEVQEEEVGKDEVTSEKPNTDVATVEVQDEVKIDEEVGEEEVTSEEKPNTDVATELGTEEVKVDTITTETDNVVVEEELKGATDEKEDVTEYAVTEETKIQEPGEIESNKEEVEAEIMTEEIPMGLD